MTKIVRTFHIAFLIAAFFPHADAFLQTADSQKDISASKIVFYESGVKYRGYSYTINYLLYCPYGSVITYDDIVAVKFYLASDRTILPEYSIYLGSDTVTVNLKGLEFSPNLSKTIKIPENISTEKFKAFHLVLVVDPGNLIRESNEDNNRSSSSEAYTIIDPPLGIDLIVSEISFGDSYYKKKGSWKNIYFRIDNQGTQALPQNSGVKIRFYLSPNKLVSPIDILLGETIYNEALPKQSSSDIYQEEIQIPTEVEEGIYHVGMLIDYDWKLTETDKNNNTASSNFPHSIIEENSSLPYFNPINGTYEGFNILIENIVQLNNNIMVGDEIGVFDGTQCVGAGVFIETFPLLIKIWQDNPQTAGTDGYESGNSITYYYWNISKKSEYRLRAIYMRGDSVFNADDAPDLRLIDTGIMILKDGEKIRTTIGNDTSLIAAAFRSGEGVSIRFDSQGTAGKVLSITQSTQPFDEIASSQRFSNPVYYVRPEIGIQDFEAEISFKYTDECILEKGIQESDLIIAVWNPANESWEEIPSQLDPVQNTLIVSTTDFSIFALVSSTETLVTSIENGAYANVPFRFHLYPNYPNPFNPSTTIRYDLAKSSEVTIRVFNILGQEVRTLVSYYLAGGAHEAIWDGTNNLGQPVSSGIYIYRMTSSEGFVDSKKMLLLR